MRLLTGFHLRVIGVLVYSSSGGSTSLSVGLAAAGNERRTACGTARIRALLHGSHKGFGAGLR
jgi:hypothetical protein